MLDGRIPAGPIEQKWDKCRFDMKLVSPANRRKHTILIVGSGLAGAAAAATLGEQGYQVQCFSYHDSPRRAHSIAAQGGINAAKNYRNDGDSVFRLFYDTIKGGDFRSREGNAYRLAQVSVNIIDQCVAQGVPFAREYGGLLATRSFGGVQVERTFYARGQTGQQLLLGAYQALEEQIAAGSVTMHSHTEMLDCRGRRRQGPRHRDARPRNRRDPLVRGRRGGAGDRRLRQRLLPVDQREGLQLHRHLAGPSPRCAFRQPCFTQIHPTCIPVTGEHQSKLTLMSESLRNDGRVWVPKKKGDTRRPNDIPEDERDYFLERRYPSFGNLVPRDVASRAAKEVCDEGRGVGPGGLRRLSRLARCIRRQGIAYDPREVRQSLRDLRADHRRERLRGADAHLPGRALHDGRPLGRLPLDVQSSRDSSSPARPTSRTRGPTAWAPAPSCRASPTATSSCRPPCPTTWPRLTLGQGRHVATPRSARSRPRSPSASTAPRRRRASARSTACIVSSAS